MAMRLGGAAQVEPHSTLVRVGRMGSKGHHLRIYALSWYLGYIGIIFFIHLYSPCGSFSLLIICNTYGYGSIPINTIFSGMNIHLPAILMFTRGTRFWHTDISVGSVMFYRHVGRNAHSLEAWDRFPSLRKRLRPKPRLQQLRGMVLVCSSITISISIGRSDT